MKPSGETTVVFRVNAIAPGVVETPLTAPIKNNPDWYGAYAAKSVFNRWARADEMAGAVVYLSSDATSYVTGSVLFVDGGWTAVDGRFAPPLYMMERLLLNFIHIERTKMTCHIDTLRSRMR